MANTVKTTFTGDVNPLSRSMRAVEADIRRYQQDQERRERELTRITERETKQRERTQLNALRRYEQEMKRVFREEERLQRERASRNASIRQGAAGVILGGAIGAGYLAQDALQKTLDQVRAQRLLSSSATEAGLSQSVLAEKNIELARTFGLSTQAAVEVTSQITRLASNSGNVQQLDRLIKAFGDLSAARGIQGQDLNTLIGTILSGQDEGLNRLGIADPGQLYRAYAEGVGKTVEQLTQAEKVQAAVNAVLEKSAIFAGAAEARMNSLEGTVLKASSAWQNFTNSLATTFTTSGPVTDFLNEASRVLGGLEINLAKVNAELAKGKTAKQIAEEQYPSPSFGDYISAGASAIIGGPALGLGLIDSATYAGAVDPARVRQRRLGELTSQIANQQTSNQFQKQAADDQARAERVKKLDADITRFREERMQREAEAFKKAEEDKQKALEATRRKQEETIKAIQSLTDQAYSSNENPFVQFLGRANSEMRQMLELAKNLSPALREAFVANAQRQNRNQLFGMRLDAQIDATGLRNRAAEFRQGFNNNLSDPATVQRLVNQLFGNLGLPTASNIGQSQFYNIRNGQVDWESGSGMYRPISRTAEQQALIDQRLIREAGNYDPSLLNQGQRGTIASAFEREATRKLDAEKNANDFYTNINKHIGDNGLKVNIDKGVMLDLLINDANGRTSNGGSSGNVNARYGANR